MKRKPAVDTAPAIEPTITAPNGRITLSATVPIAKQSKTKIQSVKQAFHSNVPTPPANVAY